MVIYNSRSEKQRDNYVVNYDRSRLIANANYCCKCLFKDYRYQYFRRRELHIILRVMLRWYIAFNFALDSKSTVSFVHQVALR